MATIQLALKGNRGALKEVWERVDGKVQQAIAFEVPRADSVDVKAAADRLRLELDRIGKGQKSTKPPG